MKSKSDIFWGIVIIGIGLAMFLNMLGIHIYLASRFVYLIVGSLGIAYGVNGLLQRKRNFIVFFTLYVGIGFILFSVGMHFGVLMRSGLRNPWAFIGPSAILALGTSMVLRQKGATYNQQSTNAEDVQRNTTFTDGADRLNIQDIFSSSVVVATSKQFQGGVISSRFSETVVDLRQVELNGNCAIEVDVLFGGVKLFIPSAVHVKMNPQTNIFSTISKNKEFVQQNEIYDLTVNGTAIFGSIEVIYE